MKKEHFVDTEGFEGLYQTSDEGRVKSLARDIVYKDGRIRHQEEKLLKPIVDKGGYLRVALCKDGKREYKSVHRLVAEAFIPNPLNLPEVNHKDEDKTNNRVENLEWCTHEYNQNYGSRNQRVAEAHTNGITSKQVFQYSLDGELVAIWPSTQECGRNGFNQGAVSDCCNNKYMRIGNNKYKDYIWKNG